MIRFGVVRGATAAAMLLLLSAVLFFSTEVLPGDAAGVVAGADATDSERAEIRERMGLDRPAAARYVTWLGDALTGDLGRSFAAGRPVSEVLASRFGNSVVLVGLAVAGIAALAVTFGLLAGLRAGRLEDRLLSSMTVALVALPEFLLATGLVVVLAHRGGMFPAVSLFPPGDAPWQHPDMLVLPVTALVLAGLGVATRLVRAAVVSAAQSPAVEQARLDGESGVRLAWSYVLPAAAAPGIQGLAVMAAGLLGGSLVVETLFNYPGVGSELARAVAYRDVAMVQGLGLVLAGAALLILFTGDLLAGWLNVRSRPAPRRRAGRRAS
ncbi:ABC transporter permease [Streptomyces sp. MH13]|uniref:ABC transporter permease n=1 Tax=unclassified Streptomyces TaxID=2593676 RepID=UPI003CE9F71A